MGNDDIEKVSFDLPPLSEPPLVRWSASIDNFGEMKAQPKDCLAKVLDVVKKEVVILKMI
ncbi:MAG TPA: hypothetical protein PLD88_00350 [Candidatus Berkiella sp.]|nr:hypothetical protein [Candidatus Berkiella sp.]